VKWVCLARFEVFWFCLAGRRKDLGGGWISVDLDLVFFGGGFLGIWD